MKTVVSALLLTCYWTSLTTAQETQREGEVYRIYSLLLTNPRTSHGPDDNPRYLIEEKTRVDTTLPMPPCVVQPPKEREADFAEVFADLEGRKAGQRTLERRLVIRKPYQLLKPEEAKAFREERGWPKPNSKRDERFAGVSDLFTLSNVYFNKSGTLALTSLSSFCGGLCALYSWKVFEKLSTGEWQERPQWVTCSAIA